MEKKRCVVAIDGPAGAGKTSTAKALAEALGFRYVDTGMMYRAIALFLSKKDIKVNPLGKEMLDDALSELDLNIMWSDGTQHVIINGESVEDAALRTDDISMKASTWSREQEVRDFLMETQRKVAQTNPVVMEGRDIGTVVFPDADVKFYLTASILARANRRFIDAVKAGDVRADDTNAALTYAKTLAARDEQDMNRTIAPLKPADDAIVIDNTLMSESETVQLMVERFNERTVSNNIKLFMRLREANPDLPVIPMVHSGIVPKEGEEEDAGNYPRWQGSWGRSRVVRYIEGREGIYFREDYDDMAIASMREILKDVTDTTAKGMTGLQIREMFDALPWKKAITVDIDLPE